MHVPPASTWLDLLVSMSSGLGETRGSAGWLLEGPGGPTLLTGETVGSGGHSRTQEILRVCACVCVRICAYQWHPLGWIQGHAAEVGVGAAQTLSTVVTLSTLNDCQCDGSRAGLMLRAFKTPDTLPKLEEDFDTDCQTSDKSCFSSPGKHSSAP